MSAPPAISAMPTLPPAALVGGRRHPLPAPLDRPGVSFWYSGRVALWQAIAALGVPAGSAVAVPAYCCGSELEPLLHAGLVLRPYCLDPSLDPEPDSFTRAADGAGAALVTHFFGFPANLGPAREICHRHGTLLIEDCAHALYATTAGEPVGTAGDAAIFSVWKSLAIPDGGALLLTTRCTAATPVALPPSAEVARHTRRLIAHHLQRHPFWPARLLVAAAQQAQGALRRLPAAGPPPRTAGDYEVVRFRPELAATAMSPLAYRLFHTTDHTWIKQRRRHRYRQIASAIDGLPGLEPLFPELRDGACPLFFPVVVDAIDPLRRTLAAKGVGMKQLWTFCHPAIPWRDFPREARLKRCTVGLPIHQCLTDAEMVRIIAALREAVDR